MQVLFAKLFLSLGTNFEETVMIYSLKLVQYFTILKFTALDLLVVVWFGWF